MSLTTFAEWLAYALYVVATTSLVVSLVFGIIGLLRIYIGEDVPKGLVFKLAEGPFHFVLLILHGVSGHGFFDVSMTDKDIETAGRALRRALQFAAYATTLLLLVRAQ